MRTLLTTILFSSLIIVIQAQTTLTGLVKDSKTGEAVIGANIFVKGTYDGASTDIDGSFFFNTYKKDTAIILISYLGYETQEITQLLHSDTLDMEVQLVAQISELDMVVITAGAFEASDEKKAVILRPLDIAMTAGATADIAGALNTLPGTQTVGEEGRLFVRGGDAYETRTFIDGLLVQKPYSSSVPDLPARGRFSPFLFKGTMFSTGGYSAEYGRALSSALVLETQGLANESLTSISLMSVGGGLGHTKRWDKSSLSISADYTNLMPYISLVPQNIEWEKPVSSYSGQAVFRQEVGTDGMLKAQASVQSSGMTMLYPDMNQVEDLLPLSLDNDNYYANASYSELLNEKWSMDAGLAYGYDKEDIIQDFELHRTVDLLQGRLKTTYYPNDQITVKMGAEWMREQFDESYRPDDDTSFETNLKSNYSAAFAEAEAYLNPKLAIRLGVRGEYFGLLKKWDATPRLSVAYKSGTFSQFSLAFGQFYQQPEFDALRYGLPEKPEKATHYILNYQFTRKKRVFRAEAYYKQYNDLMTYEADQPWLLDNSGEGYAKGLDLFYRDQELIRNGDFWLSYSLLDTKREYRDFPELAAPTFASKHNFSAVYKHWLGKINTSIGLTYSYASPRAYNDPNTDLFNDGKTASYQDLSFNASYLTNLFGQFTVLYCSVTNLPGFEQSFGYRYSTTPDEDGLYTASQIEPPAKRFFFVGLFISIGQKFED